MLVHNQLEVSSNRLYIPIRVFVFSWLRNGLVGWAYLLKLSLGEED